MEPPDRVVAALLKWGARYGRRLPWRDEVDHYHLAVAEVLLQKTKGEDAAPVWSAVVTAYPTAEALANADGNELRVLVAGLGLGNQRVQRLKAMGRTLRSGHVQDVPGLGPYAAGVLALLRGEKPQEPPVDGNIARVTSRFYGLTFERGEPRKKREVKEKVAELLASRKRAASKLRVIYALVDLGAKVCKAPSPDCPACPLSRWCDFAASRGLAP